MKKTVSLSQQEKQEILADAQSLSRRDAFRQTLVKDAPASYDVYLQFLKNMQNVFPKITPAEQIPAQDHFRL